jgi:hypothetical protein
MKRRFAFLLVLALLLAGTPRALAEDADSAYANAALFAALLDSQGFAHGEITPYEEGAYALAVTCPGGPEGPAGRLESDWYFTADAVHARLRGLVAFDGRDRAAVLAALNDLNIDWYLARYAADFSDNTVLVAADAMLSDGAAGEICADLLDTLVQRAEDAYETLRPFDTRSTAESFAPVPFALGAESGTPEDARANVKVFMDLLKAEGIDFTDCGEYDGQYIVESVCPVKNGGSITSDWIFDGRYVIGAVWNLASYDAAAYDSVLDTLNTLNLTNGTLKFLADSSDNSVTAECYQLLPREGAGELLRALYAQLLGLVQYAKPTLEALG